VLVIEARNPVREESGREAGLGREEDDGLHNIESGNEKRSKGSKRLIGDVRIIDVLAIIVVLASDSLSDSLDILCHHYHIGDEDEQQREHRKSSKGVQDEELGGLTERKHGQQ